MLPVLLALVSLVVLATPPQAVPLVAPPPLVSPPSALATSSGVQATLALEHDGRVDGAVLISELGLALTTARALGPTASGLTAALHDGRRMGAHVLALDPAHDLGLISLEAPGPYPALRIASVLPEPGGAVTAIVQPGALAWQQVPGVLVQPYASHLGRVDTSRMLVRVASPLLGEGGPLLDGQSQLVAIVASPEPGQAPADAVGISAEVLRAFLDRAAVYAPTLALRVSSRPFGAVVTVDGRPVGTTGAEPLRIERLTIGRHEVRLALPGAAEDLLSVELLQHAVEEVFRPLDVGGTLAVAANAPAEVWVDGALRGTAPLTLLVPSGPHALDLRARGYLPLTQQVDIARGARHDVDAKLERISAEVSLATVPPGAAVTVNGEPLGTTPLNHARVFAGISELGLRASGLHSYRFNVNLAPQEFRDLGTFRLEAPFGWLDARLPHGTVIQIDGGPRHQPAPFERIGLGEHKLEVFAPGYFGYDETLTIADAQTVVLDPPLALNDRLGPRRAVGYGLSGLSMALGLVSIGLATDRSTSDLVGPTLLGGAVALGAGIYCLLTGVGSEAAGWAEHRTYVAPAGTAGR
jgi:hypothetical protein